VCAGENLEFTCNITGTLLEWRFPVVSSSRRQFPYGISASDSAEMYKHQAIDNSTINITISRISAQDSPVSSRLLISPITESHNGTEVTCVDVSSSPTVESSTIIIIINDQIQGMHTPLIVEIIIFIGINTLLIIAKCTLCEDFPDVNISKIFERDAITVTLEWAQGNSSYSYYIIIIPTTQLLVNFNEITRVTVNLSYHISYNLTILIHCGVKNLTFFSQSFHYSKFNSTSFKFISYIKIYIIAAYCRNPAYLIEDSIQVFDYASPAIPGNSIAFGCYSPGNLLTGSNISICKENGEWEPDPRVAVHYKGMSTVRLLEKLAHAEY
jgi:hypothetical protein